MKVTATVQAVIFEAPQSGFKIASILIDGEEFKIKGIMPNLLAGCSYDFDLIEDEHPNYGFQFKVTAYKVSDPGTSYDMENFLASGAFKGIGKAVAKKIVEHFGDETMEILKNNTRRLKEVNGIGEKTLKMIQASVEEHLEASETLYELNKFGFTLFQAKRIYDSYGKKSDSLIKENPYNILFTVKGIGFKTIDSLALENGFESNSPERLNALILYTMQCVVYGEGHLYIEQEDLYARIRKNVDFSDEDMDKSLEILTSTFPLLHIEYLFIDDKESKRIYLSESYEWETGIVHELIRLYTSYRPRINFENTLPSIEMTEDQLLALNGAFDESVFILTGAAGTGKTTIMKELIYRARQNGLSTLIAAPTGRAASRIEELSGLQASTIHRMLEYEYDENQHYLYFNRDGSNPLDADVVFIDEASMVDAQLFYNLLKAIRRGSCLILIGDPNQLPPVGPGNPFSDMMKTGVFNVKHLKQIHRQSGKGYILKNAYSILEGGKFIYNEDDGDFFHFSAKDNSAIKDRIVELVCSRIPKVFGFDSIDSICVISPIKAGTLGVENLNIILQKALNPLSKRLYFNKFAVGDKVMQIKNNYNLEWRNPETGENGVGVFNGETGKIEIASTDALIVKFQDGKFIEYNSEIVLKELELAYAMTVHKAQGNEFDVVIFPSFNIAPVMRSKNLMYTALTRAKKLFVLVGDKYHFEMAAKTTHTIKRNSSLINRFLAVWDVR